MKYCIAILDNLRSVENTGSIFRTAECLGVSKIILIGTTPTPLDRFNRKRKDFTKISLGAEEMIEWEYSKEISPVILKLKNEGFKIIALEQDQKAIKINDFNAGDLEKFALIVGNEVNGVSFEALKLSDSVLEIPMQGKKESLNVSVSTGIAVYKLIQ